MTVYTKFSLGDTVYLLYENKVHRCTISKIIINVTQNKFNKGDYIWYNYDVDIETGGTVIDVTERRLFRTKEELLKSL